MRCREHIGKSLPELWVPTIKVLINHHYHRHHLCYLMSPGWQGVQEGHHYHHHHNRILLYEETCLVTSPNDGHRGHSDTILLHEHQNPTQCLQIQKHKYKYTSSSSSPCYSHLTTMDADETGRTSSPFRGIKVFSSMIACKRNIFIFIKKNHQILKNEVTWSSWHQACILR